MIKKRPLETHGMSNDSTRKTRSDKGLIMATRRDLYCIAWIAEQYAARVDQIQRLLSRFPDKEKPFKGDLIAETTLKDQISRWRRAGWVEYQRVLADSPAWVWPTKKGLALVDLDTLYIARPPAPTRLDHIYAVNQLRLWMDLKFAWKSERRYRSEQTALLKKGDKLGPLPDGLITTKDGPVAIEAEISAKKPADVEAKLIRLVRHRFSGNYREYAFPTIWFYVPNEKMKNLVERGIEALRDEEQERVSVGIAESMIASKFR
jgi:hypothetical protein